MAININHHGKSHNTPTSQNLTRLAPLSPCTSGSISCVQSAANNITSSGPKKGGSSLSYHGRTCLFFNNIYIISAVLLCYYWLWLTTTIPCTDKEFKTTKEGMQMFSQSHLKESVGFGIHWSLCAAEYTTIFFFNKPFLYKINLNCQTNHW